MATGLSPRKASKAKRALPTLPSTEAQRLKSVHFNEDTYETSIGGTESVGKTKKDLLLHFDAPVTIGQLADKLSVQNGIKPISKPANKTNSQKKSINP